ncbi:MAG: HAMP domain-containing histidine kinase [Firmicutes bacterium]|nr:HAMP domain-containing histidine kinase [Bacillota bacterium]
MIQKKKDWAKLLIFIIAFLAFFAFLFHSDNKYTTEMSLPQDGILSLNREDLDKPIFLIDDWQLSDGICPPGTESASMRTWIGEFSNFDRDDDPSRSPYGSGTYRLRLRYDGEDTVIGLFFPNLCNEYSLWWDNSLVEIGSARFCRNLPLTAGDHTITVAVTATSGYYAGMYFPGAIGSDAAIRHLTTVQSAVYGAAALIPMVLALFCYSLWVETTSRLYRYFALLCVSFSLSLTHYFLQFCGSSLSVLRFLISDLATYAMFFFACAVMLELTSDQREIHYRQAVAITAVFAVASTILYALAPIWPQAIRYHGILQNGSRLTLFALLIWGSIKAAQCQSPFHGLILLCDGALGISLFTNLLFSNRFEPIYTLWQYEWCGLFLVILFGIMMERQNRRILLENKNYQEHLDDLVEERTRQIHCLMEERRSFFSDMAHDLKAPLASIKTFIEVIRLRNVGLDEDLSFYIDQMERQQQEMSRRVGSLNELNAVDRLTADAELVTVADLFHTLYRTHNPEAVAMGVHLIVIPADTSLVIRVQKQKLLLAFENLIYNALRFTPADGSITIRCIEAGDAVCITVTDTGCGIPPEELPHIFERFFVGQAGKDSGGSGLGLYIVKTILEELGGSIHAESPSHSPASPSEVNAFRPANGGSCFTLRLPKA